MHVLVIVDEFLAYSELFLRALDILDVLLFRFTLHFLYILLRPSISIIFAMKCCFVICSFQAFLAQKPWLGRLSRRAHFLAGWHAHFGCKHRCCRPKLALRIHFRGHVSFQVTWSRMRRPLLATVLGTAPGAQ